MYTPESVQYVHQTQGELSCSRAIVCWMNADNMEHVCFTLAVCVLHNNVGRLKFCSISSSILQVINCEGCLVRHSTTYCLSPSLSFSTSPFSVSFFLMSVPDVFSFFSQSLLLCYVQVKLMWCHPNVLMCSWLQV